MCSSRRLCSAGVIHVTCWRTGILFLGMAAVGWPALAETPSQTALSERTRTLLANLDANALAAGSGGAQILPAANVQIRRCRGYPYHEGTDALNGARTLLSDLRKGLQTGLQCLAGQGPMGRLHPYHEQQAARLLTLFEDSRVKTLTCVEDAMFATAVASSPRGTGVDDPLYTVLREVDHPAIVLDTYRLGGFLSRRFDDETYRSFFHLADAQIIEHRNGQPLRPANLHRFADRPALLFHETVHWLGHEHSALYPDLALLYETCCFGGSDYIDDPVRNRAHQLTACAILRDGQLWSNGDRPSVQMHLWHDKGYDTLKPQMRADYAP